MSEALPPKNETSHWEHVTNHEQSERWQLLDQLVQLANDRRQPIERLRVATTAAVYAAALYDEITAGKPASPDAG